MAPSEPRSVPLAEIERDGLVVRLINSARDFGAIKDAWLALESQTDEPCLFQSYAWCGHLASVLEQTFKTSYSPVVTIAYRERVPVALLPLSRQKRSGIWHLRTLDDPFGQMSCMLYVNRADAETLVAATLDLVRSNRLGDILQLDRVVSGSPLESGLNRCKAATRGEVGAPVVETSQWADFDALKSSRNKKTMKNLRNSMNRLAKAGPHHHVVESGHAAVHPIIAATVRRRSDWMTAKGLTAPQFRSPAHDEVLTGGQGWGLDAMRAGFELHSNGVPIAHQWGFIHQRRYYAYMSATDPSAVALSPGRLHLAFVIADAMKLGVDAVEMLTPASDYKLVWTDQVRTLRNMTLPLSAVGRGHDLLWERSVRPFIKAVFYALPAQLRRRAIQTEAITGSESD